ncbi:hypothetical protein FHW69_003809 [Luteibacter sp. Sphag1AF]|uniref:hypothetical protein n=1 Tax=Luteibacter sp. Sphag1AF TaxID=2587031 RepID=UPI00160FBA23|nr:hypothetical protein [Luteibacter sp. Sphag1AF]MBB3229155.1 hypothetical protein [Luteibacter sp. Sphag1AF]
MAAKRPVGHSAQEALAKLVVNPPIALRVLRDGCPESVGLFMAEADRQELVAFLDQHGPAFRMSVLLLRKRRMDNVLETLSTVSQMFSDYELACYWDDYLDTLDLHVATPKNPLLESVYFARHVLTTLPANDVHSSIVAYDLARNEVIAAVAADEAIHPVPTNAVSPSDWAPYVHPAMRSANFMHNVSAMVRMVTRGAGRNEVLQAHGKKAETIVFFKNWRKGGVGSMCATTPVVGAMSRMDGRKSAQHLESQSPGVARLIDMLADTGAVIRVTAGKS